MAGLLMFIGFALLEPRKKPFYFPLYWLVNRDPYNGRIIIPIYLGSIIPYITRKQPGFFSLLTWRIIQ